MVKWSQLREIDAGLMDSLTYEYVAAEMPDEYEARKKDKLRYRWVVLSWCAPPLFFPCQALLFDGVSWFIC